MASAASAAPPPLSLRFWSARSQARTINHGHPLQAPSLCQASFKDLIELVTPRLHRHRQLVQMPAVQILDAE